VSSSKNARKLLHLHPYMTPVVHKFYAADREARLNFVNWYLQEVNAGKTDRSLSLLNSITWFHLSRYVYFQNKRDWFA
jgi:hypothetical protein